MRTVLIGALLFAATASPAAAQVTFTSTAGVPDAGYGSQTLIANFNLGTGTQSCPRLSYQGLSFTGSCAIYRAPGVGGVAAAPAGVTTGGFFAASPGTPTIIDFTSYVGAQTFTALSFYWGSIDSYNKLELLDVNGNPLTITGFGSFIEGSDVTVGAANGDQVVQRTNRRLFLDLSATPTFRKLRLTSTSPAFEIDDIAGTLTTVPEPATVSVLALGLVALGAAVVRRKRRDASMD